MKLSQYKFSLPPDLIAKYPSPSRDESRLMIMNRETGEIEHKVFKDIIDYRTKRFYKERLEKLK